MKNLILSILLAVSLPLVAWAIQTVPSDQVTITNVDGANGMTLTEYLNTNFPSNVSFTNVIISLDGKTNTIVVIKGKWVSWTVTE